MTTATEAGPRTTMLEFIIPRPAPVVFENDLEAIAPVQVTNVEEAAIAIQVENECDRRMGLIKDGYETVRSYSDKLHKWATSNTKKDCAPWATLKERMKAWRSDFAARERARIAEEKRLVDLENARLLKLAQYDADYDNAIQENLARAQAAIEREAALAVAKEAEEKGDTVFAAQAREIAQKAEAQIAAPVYQPAAIAAPVLKAAPEALKIEGETSAKELVCTVDVREVLAGILDGVIPEYVVTVNEKWFKDSYRASKGTASFPGVKFEYVAASRRK